MYPHINEPTRLIVALQNNFGMQLFAVNGKY